MTNHPIIFSLLRPSWTKETHTPAPAQDFNIVHGCARNPHTVHRGARYRLEGATCEEVLSLPQASRFVVETHDSAGLFISRPNKTHPF